MARKPITLRSRAVNSGEQAPAQDQATTPPSEQTGEPTKRITLDVPESLHRKLKILALEEGTTMAALLRCWAEERVS